jgi:hypothetical protein
VLFDMSPGFLSVSPLSRRPASTPLTQTYQQRPNHSPRTLKRPTNLCVITRSDKKSTTSSPPSPRKLTITHPRPPHLEARPLSLDPLVWHRYRFALSHPLEGHRAAVTAAANSRTRSMKRCSSVPAYLDHIRSNLMITGIGNTLTVASTQPYNGSPTSVSPTGKASP